MKFIQTFFLLALANFAFSQTSKQAVIKSIDEKNELYSGTAKKIWEFAEVGYQEEKSSALLQQTLKDAGFSIEAGIAGEPTAFIATAGSGKPASFKVC